MHKHATDLENMLAAQRENELQETMQQVARNMAAFVIEECENTDPYWKKGFIRRFVDAYYYEVLGAFIAALIVAFGILWWNILG